MVSAMPRLFVTLIGDISCEPPAQVKYGFFIKALERVFQVVVCDATLRGLPRLLNALQVFSPNRKLWKERFYQNVPAFRLRSQRIAQVLHQHAGKVDAILQIGALYDALWSKTNLPSVIYTDYTHMLASRKQESGRSPFTPNERSQWLDLEKQSFQRAAHICTRGQFVRHSILQDYQMPASQVSAIGGGVNFSPLPDLSRKAPGSTPTALFIGKDFYRKGGDLLLKAFSNVRQVIPNAQLVMVTEGFPGEKYDLSGVRVVSPTWDRAIIQNLYAQADCFVLPSRLETWGDVLLEAMAYGVPCIGVNGEAMGEIIKDGKTGLVTPPGDTAALTTALVHLLSSRERSAQFGAAARESIESTYTWDHVVGRLIPIFETIQEGRLKSANLL
jgi:glycosyltransferase involved in cell wall biosynthesis